MVQQWWQKLNGNERLAATGAVIVFVAALLGAGWLSLLGAATVLVIYWLKYAPNQTITWPAPIELINLAISAIIGLFALLGVLFVLGVASFGFGVLGFFGGFLGGIYLLVVAGAIAFAAGAAMMVLGTWREYQALPKAVPPSSSPAPPSTSPSSPPSGSPGSPPSGSSGPPTGEPPTSAPPSTPPSTPPSQPGA